MANFTVDSLTRDLKDIAFIKDEEKILSFEGRQMKLNSAEDAQVVVDEIESNHPFTTLVFKGNTINVAASEKIADALKKCHKLTRALWSDMFTGRSKQESPPALKLMCNALVTAGVSLTELDLSDNAFGPAGADAIKDFLASRCCYTLKTLKLNNDGLGIGGGKTIAESLISCWKSSKKAGTVLKLKCFVAGRNRLENDGARALAIAFKTIGTLEEISLPQNGIYYEGISALSEAFAENRNLKCLNLEDNILTEMGAASIASILKNLNLLETLNLNDCLLRSRGALALAKSLKHCCSNLKELLITGNEINSKGAIEIAHALFGKLKFEKVDLGGNNFGESGIAQLQSLFKDHKALNRLEFSCDDEGEEDDDDKGGRVSSEGDAANSFVEEYVEEEDQFANVDVDHFLSTFDEGALCDIGDEAPYLIAKRVRVDLINPYYAVYLLLKISSLITPDCHQQIREMAFLTCKEILGMSEFRVFTDILAQKLGLIKSENKAYHRPRNLYGILYVLKKECSEPYFKPVRDVLKFLAEKHAPRIPDSEEKQMWTDFYNSV